MTAPALVVGHRADVIHPFSDAEALVRHLPDARLVRASSIAELRMQPRRLLAEIDSFLSDVWGGELASVVVADTG
jgi:hypothetical protein